MTLVQDTVGDVLREWRRRRRLSQLGLACEAEVSTRHLSFLESGRSSASRDMLMRLAERLEMPLRERSRLLMAGGYAPVHQERPLDAPDMTAARMAIDAVLAGHAPFPALAVDRHWTLVAANAATGRLLRGVAAEMLAPPVNVLRLSLHPAGLAPRIENLAEWRHHILERLRVQAADAGDAALFALHAELSALSPRPPGPRAGPVNPVFTPLRLCDPDTGAVLSFLSTTTVFGTATDVTLSELTIEGFYPADEATRRTLIGRESDAAADVAG